MNELPISLLESLEKAPGFNRTSFEAVHSRGEQVTSVRINPAKCHPEEIALISSAVPWSRFGYYLSERPSFTLDPLLHAGGYYVQEASSMFLEQALIQHADINSTLKVLDLCAAPGGKSTLIQSLISSKSLLVSNEVIKSRAGILQENMTKWGGLNVVITSNDPRDFGRLQNYFDVIVTDVPCSGSGLFRRDPDAIREWSESNVQLCSQRQQRILADVIPSLKKDGLLVYCTCSYSMEEDEQIVDQLCEDGAMTGLQININPSWNIVEAFSPKHNIPCYRFYPDRVKGEGFFLSCMRRNDGGDARISSKHKIEKISRNDLQLVSAWIDNTVSPDFFKYRDEIKAIPPGLAPEIAVLQERLFLKQVGVTIGKSGHGELIPEHSFALSSLTGNSIPKIALEKDQALQYLRKSDMSLTTNEKGWALITWQGHNLGWVKLLGNRVNNYYPKEWRILKA